MKIGLWDGDTLVWRFGWIDNQTLCVTKLHDFIKEYTTKLKLTTNEFYLGSPCKSNFRYKIYQDYKANRKDSARPPNESQVREYLLTQCNATIIKGAECDDALGIRQMECIKNNDKSIILTNDKDLDMIPGWHCDLDYKREIQYKDKIIVRRSYKKKRLYKVEDDGSLELLTANKKKVLVGTGKLWFCAQMLLGDNSDNIPGLYRLSGEKKAGDVFVYEYLKDTHSYKDAILKVYELYKEHVEDEEAFFRNAKLLWIKRKKGKEEIFDKSWFI